ncbi:MAG: metallophosphoesterase [Isosphaeraceae bacterium]
MNAPRTWIAASLLFAAWPTLLLAQDARSQDAPRASANSPRAATNKAAAHAPDGPFLARPYLQLGSAPAVGKLELMWHAADTDAEWSVAYRAGPGARWQGAETPLARRVAVVGIEPHRVYRVPLTGLEPGVMFAYRVSRNGKAVFESEARAPKAAGQRQRFVAFGDCGAGTPEQKAIAYRAMLCKPDYVLIPGDIVYGRGLATEYRDKFWPIYNADATAANSGASLMRSTLFVAAAGNHDIASRDLGKLPDGLAYFYYWSQPLNGPLGREGGPITAPILGPEANRKAFLEAAGDAFPRMANFSFDYGDVHWTVLDSNPTVDWTSNELREWVERDLAAARGAAWRFVAFHHPGFHSSRSHFDAQSMRILAPLFEAGKVDLAFSGHVHNYQRSYPLRFVPAVENGAAPAVGKAGRVAKDRLVGGRWTLDRKFNGRTDTTPEGVIYLVTGAGGQHLYNPEQQDDPASWQEFTYKHVSKVFSLTVVDVDGPTVTVRQLTPEGDEVDHFVVTH